MIISINYKRFQSTYKKLITASEALKKRILTIEMQKLALERQLLDVNLELDAIEEAVIGDIERQK
jgi:predicted  nucleic acid-binding Zn-ribbon protein